MANKNSFIPPDFNLPHTHENKYLRIRMLTIHDVVKDYDAVMTSIAHLHNQFPHWDWPAKDLTLEQDLIDLAWHQKEFQLRRSFAFAVVSLDESQVYGSVYIDPSNKLDFDAEVHLWVRSSELKNGLDKILFQTVKQWVSAIWPFTHVAYPGREINWDEWQSMN